jgi:energy-coupling factor transporter ATP-binding protein EcfA2
MQLKKYRVTNFRSVKDSGWIDVDKVTALIGTNESGKTNLLLPLWRLNPATADGKVNVTSDHPRKLHTEFRSMKVQPVFIEAHFDVGDALAKKLAKTTGFPEASLKVVSVSRRFDGEPIVDYPGVASNFTAKRDEVKGLLTAASSEIDGLPADDQDQDLRTRSQASLAQVIAAMPTEVEVSTAQLKALVDPLKAVSITDGATSTCAARFRKLLKDLEAMQAKLAKSHPRESQEATKAILEALPKFVYYSNYGNLDSEIYLPTVIANLKRTDMGARETAKARTLKVLFEFVKLTPQEILDLGQEPAGTLTEEQTKAAAEKKRTRSILTQSASAMLTDRFREWWKQGNYRFRFEADGNFFRLWVSDDKRPEEVELEGRSSGLQWFLSFYLVFLVESRDTHSNSILLLDEPGVALHPLSQRDLSKFFDGLAKGNQLLYTTHSPFLVDADRLDRARKVFIDVDGTSKASPDLGVRDGDPSQKGAGYAVHAAIGLSIAESLLLGCTPVVVEGASDQHYLTAAKTLLIAAGRLKPGRELVFPPADGAKGVKAVSTILTGRDDELPIVLLDSDEAGRTFAAALKKEMYAKSPELVLEVAKFCALENAEIEDLIPASIFVPVLDRWQRADQAFADVHDSKKAIVPQIKEWAKKNQIELKLGWKGELAALVKAKLLQLGHSKMDGALDTWNKLFEAFQQRERKA